MLGALLALELALLGFLTACAPAGAVLGSPWEEGAVEAARERFIVGYGELFPGSAPESVRCARVIVVERMPVALGVTVAPCLVVIASYGSPDPEPTSLWHELVHVELWHRTGDPDADHAEGDGPWTAAHDDVQRILAEQWLLETSGEGR